MKIKCINCGDNIEYKPELSKCLCDSCGSLISVEDLEKEINTQSEEDNSNIEYNEYECCSCGAKLITNDEDLMARCIYCNSIEFIKRKMDKKYMPDGIIPFSISKKEFIEKYKKYLKWNYVPQKFIENIELTKVKGAYIPFYYESINAKVEIRGIFERKSLKRNNVVNEEIFDAKFKEKISTLQDASFKFSDKRMSVLMPFNMSKLKKFSPAYMCGFYAEIDSETPKELDKKIEKTINIVIKEKLEKEFIGFKQKSGIYKIDCENEQQKYVLLPIWSLMAEYEGEKYIFAMNGQTGKPFGIVPEKRTKKKKNITIINTILIILAIIAEIMMSIFIAEFFYDKYEVIVKDINTFLFLLIIVTFIHLYTDGIKEFGKWNEGGFKSDGEKVKIPLYGNSKTEKKEIKRCLKEEYIQKYGETELEKLNVLFNRK